MKVKVTQSCPTLCDPMDYTVHGILQARTLEQIPFTHFSILGLPWWLSWQRIHLQCRRPGFDPWVGKIPRRRERLLTPVFWPGEFHGLYSPWGCKELDTIEWLLICDSTEKIFPQETENHCQVLCMEMRSYLLYTSQSQEYNTNRLQNS